MSRLCVLFALGLTLLIGVSQVSAQGQSARAELKNAQGQVVGDATFTQQPAGVQVRVAVRNLDPGAHGIHIHAVGKCDAPDFASAGGHFNPANKKHGHDSPEGPHAGDLGNPPNLTVGADRAGSLTVTTNQVTLSAGATSLMDADGSALVIHAGPDDNKTDPAGNSGARIVCGVIQLAQGAPTTMPTTGGPPQTVVLLVLWLGAVLALAGMALRRALI